MRRYLKRDSLIDGKPRAVWEPGILHHTSWTGEELTYNPAHEPWKIDKNAPLTLKCNEAFKAYHWLRSRGI